MLFKIPNSCRYRSFDFKVGGLFFGRVAGTLLCYSVYLVISVAADTQILNSPVHLVHAELEVPVPSEGLGKMEDKFISCSFNPVHNCENVF